MPGRKKYSEMKLIEKIKNKNAHVGIIGLGYVGLPLARAFCEQNIKAKLALM